MKNIGIGILLILWMLFSVILIVTIIGLAFIMDNEYWGNIPKELIKKLN